MCKELLYSTLKGFPARLQIGASSSVDFFFNVFGPAPPDASLGPLNTIH